MLKLQPATLSWVLAYVKKYGDSDLLPVAFEYEAIASQWTTVQAHLSSRDVTSWDARASRRLLGPKSRFGFRSVTQLDPYDFFIYTGLAYEIGNNVEASRLPKS